MKSREKLQVMEEKISLINTTILKNRDWNIEFINRGANNYCLVIKLKNNIEYYNGTFATYESVLSALDLILNMFSAELNNKGGK
jgi:hypothetical protein